jgi:MFS family permease
MIKQIKANPMYGFLLLLAVAMSIGFQAWRTLFNNFAVEEAGINGLQAGVIQSVREIPGFLALLVVFLLYFIKEHALAALSVAIMGVGVFLTGLFPNYGGLVVTTLLMSIGFHYFETMNQSLTLQHFSKKEAPIMIGKVKSIVALTNIVVGVVIWFSSKYFELSWHFLFFGILVLAVGVFSLFKNPVNENAPVQYKKMILKKKYWLFYTLNFLGGARRQIFVVFAVFMLVERYNYSVGEVAALFVVNNIITYFMAPIIAKGINRFGERTILSIEYSSLIVLFLCYAFVENRTAVAVLYVLDHVFFSASMAINTYFQKTADPKHIAPSMAVGFTINHISAVVIPVIGGVLWMVNWRVPFIAGAAIALLSLVFAQKVKVRE